jgi:hypothetical protein
MPPDFQGRMKKVETAVPFHGGGISAGFPEALNVGFSFLF